MTPVDLGIKSVVIGVMAWAMATALKRSSAGTRHKLLCFSIVGVCVLPVVAGMMPEWHVPFLTVVKHSAPVVPIQSVNVQSLSPSRGSLPDGSMHLSVAELASGLWGLGAILLAFRLAVRLGRLSRLEKSLQMNGDSRLRSLCDSTVRGIESTFFCLRAQQANLQ